MRQLGRRETPQVNFEFEASHVEATPSFEALFQIVHSTFRILHYTFRFHLLTPALQLSKRPLLSFVLRTMDLAAQMAARHGGSA
jgi:hypothetical protein